MGHSLPYMDSRPHTAPRSPQTVSNTTRAGGRDAFVPPLVAAADADRSTPAADDQAPHPRDLTAAAVSRLLPAFSSSDAVQMRPVTPGPGRLLLVRHGETEWSRDGRHTGWTDLPLTDAGRERAADLPALLEGHRIVHVRCSPLQRAAETLHLAGLQPDAWDADLMEWDYGAEEGRTTEQARQDGRPGWTVFDGVPPGETPGETVEMVAARASRVLGRIWEHLQHGDVLLGGHGHHQRVLAAVYLRQTPYLADSLEFEAGHLCVLGHHRTSPTILHWNLAP